MNVPNAVRKETIYRGMNGRTVERVYMEGGGSRIVKPWDADSREVWVYEHVLPALPPVYPGLIERWQDDNGERPSSWIAFEDLGELRHEYKEELALEVVRLAARWHALPASMLAGADLKGIKPAFPQLVADLRAPALDMPRLAARTGIDPEAVRQVYERLETETISPETVFSHGDLHVGNYAHAAGRLYIIDWEHAHLNSRYWDLYHVIDLSHPLYPRTAAPAWRERLLQAYLDEAAQFGAALDRLRFRREYNLFAMAFSLWMVRLIESDRASGGGPWTLPQLERQAAETAAVFREAYAAYMEAERQAEQG